MKERPILFNGEMVRAILYGRKTQTRRVVKPQPTTEPIFEWNGKSKGFAGIQSSHTDKGLRAMEYYCPHGKVGDRLWVRETWQGFRQVNIEYNEWEEMESPKDRHDYLFEPVYKADGKSFAEKWQPSIFMPREYSRILLEITDIRVERLQNISRGDAMAEGCPFPNMAAGENPVDWFSTLWDSLNGKDPQKCWSANPWVWTIQFKMVKS